MALPMDTSGDTLLAGTRGPGGRNTAFASTCGSGLRGSRTRAMGETGRPLRKTFFLHCQERHPEVFKIPTCLPCSVKSSLYTEFVSSMCVLLQASACVVEHARVLVFVDRWRCREKRFTLCARDIPLCCCARRPRL